MKLYGVMDMPRLIAIATDVVQPPELSEPFLNVFLPQNPAHGKYQIHWEIYEKQARDTNDKFQI